MEVCLLPTKFKRRFNLYLFLTAKSAKNAKGYPSCHLELENLRSRMLDSDRRPRVLVGKASADRRLALFASFAVPSFEPWQYAVALYPLVLAELLSSGVAMSESHDTKSFRIDYRHLTFFFLGAVCVCAVFFALGFVVGRAQAFETALEEQEDPKTLSGAAVSSPSAPSDLASAATKEESLPVSEADASQGAARADYRKDLDFYSAVKEQKVDQNFHPESPKSDKPAASAKK